MPPAKKQRKAPVRSSRRLAEAAAVAEFKKTPWLLNQLTDGFLKEPFLPFLSVNDLTNLSMACRALNQVVSSFRTTTASSSNGTVPHLIWEETQPTKIGYETQMGVPLVRWEGPILCLAVFQIQLFGFLVRDPATGQTFQVDFELNNLVWKERGNARMMDSNERFPSATMPRIAIIQPKQYFRPQQRKRMFVAHPPSEAGEEYCCFLGEDGGQNDYIHYTTHDRDDRSEQDKQELRDAMRVILICAQRIAAHSNNETTYPSAEYLMRALPGWLHQYFPADFEWTVEHQDRQTVVEFDYRPAPTLAAWEAIIPPMHDGIYRYDPLDLPQHRDV